ncbi:hypothetical protein AM587_10001614 [Phytophthora nicotianae]|uniref:Uncharacterized protein n=2 Tax=Phytophthora nicotianae TaxID=4792 RepID=V9EL61_PHYNI|nr:hypothetical protein F443_14746 [Phytophthora nicotianae P1569]KUF64405.1 hypothetical protein AM587_10001614 [Phytophthora nicotianae]
MNAPLLIVVEEFFRHARYADTFFGDGVIPSMVNAFLLPKTLTRAASVWDPLPRVLRKFRSMPWLPDLDCPSTYNRFKLSPWMQGHFYPEKFARDAMDQVTNNSLLEAVQWLHAHYQPKQFS